MKSMASNIKQQKQERLYKRLAFIVFAVAITAESIVDWLIPIGVA